MRFAAEALRHEGKVRYVANGGCMASFGHPNRRRLCLMSGVHGDERSGPLALLQWLEQAPPGAIVGQEMTLWIAPLINDKGWDANVREWNGINLNAAFLANATPDFIQEYMSELAQHMPDIFLDHHEDSEKPYAYVYRYTADRNDFTPRLQQALDATDVTWSPSDEERWKGSTEVYVRRLGCERCATIEAPPVWPLPQRIEWNQRAVRWCVSQLGGAAAGP
jgi:predicted deacylase